MALPAAVYGACLLLVVFWPEPVDKYASGDLSRALAWLHARGLPPWFDYGLVERLANVAMFVPFGFLLSVALPPRRWWVPPVAGMAASLAIELTQHAVLRDRFGSLGDVGANTVGAVLGTVLCAAVVGGIRARRLRRSSR